MLGVDWNGDGEGWGWRMGRVGFPNVGLSKASCGSVGHLVRNCLFLWRARDKVFV